MSFSHTVAKYSIKKTLLEKWQLTMWIVIPLVIGGLFSLITDSEGQPKPVGVLLVTDHDETMLSEFVTGSFSRGPLAEIFRLKRVSAAEAEKLMADSEASAWVEVPKGFSDSFLANKPSSLKLVKNPSQNILPNIAETSLTLVADAGHYIQNLFGKELQTFNQVFKNEDISDAQMAQISVQIKKTIEQLQGQLFPPQLEAKKKVVQKKSNKQTQKQSETTFLMLMFPGIMFMSLMFAAQGLALEFWKDKSSGVLRRIFASPQELGAYQLGKAMYSFVAFLIIAVVIGVLGLIMLNANFSKLFVILFWVGLSGMVLWSMMLFLCLLMPSEKSASIVTSAMVFPLLMLGGSFFPFESMPKWMVAIGQWLPNGYLVQSFKKWFTGGQALDVLLMPSLIAVVVIFLFYLVNHRLLKSFARSHS